MTAYACDYRETRFFIFERAIQAARDGALSGVDFDPQLHYPTRIDLAGPPDASGSEFAGDLRPSR